MLLNIKIKSNITGLEFITQCEDKKFFDGDYMEKIEKNDILHVLEVLQAEQKFIEFAFLGIE